MQPIRPVIEHMSIGVSIYARSLAFYDAVLAPLGLVRVMTFAEAEGESACWGPLGERPSPEGRPGAAPFWIQHRVDTVTPPPGFHLCFMAPSRVAVDAFHAAGLTSGGRDAGPPGLRPHYGEGYYAAFLFDPDGWKIEAVTYTDA
ncbi:VOC family protein [Ancylobacter amanitiformis]|uniref:Catechol 2,3-dioxygenase-like lactoylglutathione lyase family enzyme n=1 Tax=Ancylobacter amanitiformis TaxID=217069 RepID=A0ABU0LS07_9HYPH|nr:VOC family protein [Ancylobacter amanitiformis]MDQ0511479.1 catechol 2,3-dioxygenase-like lactoylglutathione lyase family enzyme [Ancylobacter amanitiformis]